ncbi:MAG: hypothetical protein K0S45_4082 [Nitrospira sp.]|nr:hypothetical protein [Nitrospira sp.]
MFISENRSPGVVVQQPPLGAPIDSDGKLSAEADVQCRGQDRRPLFDRSEGELFQGWVRMRRAMSPPPVNQWEVAEAVMLVVVT